MVVFSIAGIDLSKYILVPTYTVNSEKVSRDWTDGNGIEHSNIIRRRISGNFKMKFFNKEKYLEILKLFRENEADDGYTPVTLYINNLDETKTIVARVTTNPANTMPLYGVSDYEGFNVNIREK